MTCYPRNDVDFEWQAWKAEANVEKHDIGFEEASTVFADPLAAHLRRPGPLGRRVS